MPIDTDEDNEEIATPAYPTTYKDEVKKLKKIIKEIQKNHDNLLDAAKYNAKESSARIKDLEDKFNKVSNIAEALAFTATGKDPGEIL
uniref:WGS project CBMG000000000 data, contig CS5907-c002881 n=1 Tax=Fusarium acuminatum CS5907 TaxID=1318461 RepID=A0A090MG28_9HYPO|nr:unnamed protein product [Fusarium acuminatum CS5907]